MESKVCTKCGCVKLINSDNFYKDKCKRDGYSARCKECINEWKNVYIKTDSYKIKRKLQPSYNNVPSANKKKYPELAKKRRGILKANGYYKSNEYKLYRKKWAYSDAMRKLIRRAISHEKYGVRTEQKLGYTYQQFKERIELSFKTGMSWDNHGEWHVDHIIPVSSFSEGTDARIVNALDNLQALWAFDNLSKGNKIHQFNNY